MFRKSRKKRAQSTAEYAIIIAIVVGAVVAMQVYVKRGLQGRIKDVVQYTGNEAAAQALFTTDQYEPYYATSNMTSTRDAQQREELSSGGRVEKTIVGQEVSSRIGTQTTLSANEAD